jgi:hypothetical protein
VVPRTDFSPQAGGLFFYTQKAKKSAFGVIFNNYCILVFKYKGVVKMENTKLNFHDMVTSTQDEDNILDRNEVTADMCECDAEVQSGKEYFDYIRSMKNEDNDVESDYSSAFMTF